MNKATNHNSEEVDILEIIGISWAYKKIILLCVFLSLIISVAYSFNKKINTQKAYYSQASLYFPMIDKNNSANLALEVLSSFASYEHLKSKIGFENQIDFQSYSSNLNLKNVAQTIKIQYSASTKEDSLQHLEHILSYMNKELGSLIDRKAFYIIDKPFFYQVVVLTKPTKTALIISISVIIGLTFGIIISFLLYALKKIRSNPDSLKKIKGELI